MVVMMNKGKTMTILSEYDAEIFLKKEGFPVVQGALASNIDESQKIAQKLGFPVVLKDPFILHKTDRNKVITNVFPDTLKRAYLSLKSDNVLIQKQLSGCELLAGIKKDPVFGHVIVTGFGGTLTELIQDMTLRLCPISSAEADNMLSELKTHNLLEEFRGRKVNRNALISLLIRLSRLPNKYPSVHELDINPIIVNESSATIVDARIVFDDKTWTGKQKNVTY